MRKLIVKYLALSYRVKVFGKEFTFVRAANVIVPLLLLLFLALLNNENYPIPDFFTWVMLEVNAVVWLIVLGYLKMHPVQWHELDREQKWFYGNGIRMGKLSLKLTDTQSHEYQRIDNYERFDKSRFHNVKAFLVNPIAVITLILVLVL